MDSIETLRNFHARKARRQEQQAREQRESYESTLPYIVSGILERDPEVELVILSGSLARGNH
jgi:predicted nucleotidyltransferase